MLDGASTMVVKDVPHGKVETRTAAVAPIKTPNSDRASWGVAVVRSTCFMTNMDYELARSVAAEGLTLYIRSVLSPWIFRLVPMREEDQPRLWYVRVEPCLQANVIALTVMNAHAVVGRNMTRDELLLTLGRVKSDTREWLAELTQQDLVVWMDRVNALAVPAELLPKPAKPVALPSPLA